MKIVKKIVLVLVVLLVAAALAGASYVFYLKPKYDGELTLQHIQKETTVYFDDFGVPHIYAASNKDAMTALGYVHAQDRLWQMELMRRIAPGRLSELFGNVALKNDKFFSGLGIEAASAKAIAALDKNSESYQLTMAYLDGINDFLENGPTPIEFQLIGVPKQKFTIEDVYNIYGYMSFSFAMAQKSDPLMTDIRDKYGIDYLKDLGLDGSFASLQIKNAKGQQQEYAAISKAVAALLDNSPIPPFIGSNSWVIAPQKTKGGKVIFANDPHLGFSQPGTWYEAHIVTPEMELYGCYLAGTPYPLLGHNREYAYGLTMFENDDIDLYQEENNPANAKQYKTPTGFDDYAVAERTIKVKDSSDVVLNVKTTRHGPLMNDLIDGLDAKKPVAMSWIYTQQPLHILEAVYKLSHAKSKADFQNGVSLISAPGLNVMYGDAKGNVAWWATGKLYKHKEGVNPNFILNGASGNDDIAEFLDFSKNPSAENPDWGYVYSANNQPEAVDGFLYPGYYLPEDRAKRITTLLDAKPNWDKEAVSKMLVDNTSMVSPQIIKQFVSIVDQNKLSDMERSAIAILKKWQGTNDLKDVAPTIYNKWVYFYLKNTFEDELGAEGFKRFLDTHIMKQVIANQISKEESVWWDNTNTENKKETRAEVITKSFKETITSLEKQLGSSVEGWTWDKVHLVEFQHPIGKIAAFRQLFNVGPFATAGTNEVIDNQFYTYGDTPNYTVKGGPSTRRIVDFSDIENSWSILPTGQSGNPFSAHYKDQAELYNAGKFRKMKMNKEEIIKSGTKLILKPAKN
ncbi:penicillin acylase family protein [Flavobacterium sp.]|uniref:penicillin acylase family protein n=1 Tax=Flavobacterium sp. TaxID=239 RepID=UPI00263347A0|nr:penicillin acylase family protein [Flavobacterium sp.]MDG2433177.1 penicillin acylase family protein [Flavobacterium sp.]